MALDMQVDDTDRQRMQLTIQQHYVDFLDDANDDGISIDKIKDMIKKEKVRVTVNVNDLRRKNEARCIALIENGFEEIPLFQRALREVVATINPDYAKEKEEFFIGLEGSFGAKHVTPRSLSARFLGNVICLEGIVTKCSMIRPKVVRSVHYCPATKKMIDRRYGDVSSFDTMPSVNMYPTKDDHGNLLETEYGLSKYRDHQTITIQEMPEKAPTGQLPRAVDLVLDNDLVDTCKPGDRILVVGVFRCLPGKQGGYTTGVFKGVILANNVVLMTKDANLRITKEDVTECKRFSRTAHPFNTLARSLAPSIHGHDFIKKAVLCLLLGGVEKILANGTRLRGDINVLLIGDPSVAKSQMLRYVGNVAPRVVLTTGRGSSGVGLTAAVTTDGETGERRLEAGAMVLADRGIVCIDEFDKMTDADRTSIHEVMEQGRVTISKAGIHARLNARTSVLAAANPVYGRYDEYKSPMDNIGLQDSLLSRFDLLFIVLDVAEPELDRCVAEHVLRMHRYRNPNEQEGEPTPLFQGDIALSTMTLVDEHPDDEKTPTFEKHDPLLHGSQVRTRNNKVLSMEFIKKYLHIAKCIKPILTTEASRVIAEEYTRLRSFNSQSQDSHLARTQPITARSLETLIRLSTAHARARMSKQVTKDDANAAIELVQFAYFKRVLEREKKKRRRGERSGDGDSDAEGGLGEGDDGGSPGQSDDDADPDGHANGVSPKRARTNGTNGHAPEHEPTADEMEQHVAEVAALIADPVDQPDQGPSATITDEQYTKFSRGVATYFQMERVETIPHDQLLEWFTTEEQGFARNEVVAGLRRLEQEDVIMESDGIVFLL